MKQLLPPISRLRLGDLAPALGVYLAVAASTAANWAPAASETAFLAWLSGAVLLAATILDRRPALPAAMLVVTAAWILPPGASRGMAITTLLALALLAGAWMRRSELGSALVSLPLALGLQILLRAEDLLGATPRGACEILLPAILTAGALAWIAEPSKNQRLVAIAIASVVIAGSFDIGLASTFLIFAGGNRLVRAGMSKRHLLLAAAGLLLLGLWEPRNALLAILATMVILGSGRMLSVAATAAILGGVLLASSSWGEALVQLYWLPIVLPAAWLPGRSPGKWLIGLVVALAGARILPLGTAPAAAMLLLAMESDPRGWSVQKRWSAISLAGVLFMATYPWLRLDPAVDALARFGFGISATAAIVIVTSLALITYSRRWLARAADLALIALAFALLLHLPRPTISLVGYDPVDLGATRNRVVFDTPATPTRYIAVSASASNSLALEVGTPLATITVHGHGDQIQSWVLEAGKHVGEWAARRADLRDRPELRLPRPWVAWSVPQFFGRSFRSLHELESEIEVVAIEIVRHPGVSPEIGLRIDHLDLRP